MKFPFWCCCFFFYWTTVIFEMVSGFTYSRTLCAWWKFSQHYVTLKSFSVACYVSKSALSRACWLQKIGHMPSGANFVCSAECSSMDMNAGALFSSVAFTVQEKLVQAILMWPRRRLTQEYFKMFSLPLPTPNPVRTALSQVIRCLRVTALFCTRGWMQLL